MAEHSHQRLRKMVTFNNWIDIKSLGVWSLPLEARLVVCIVGRSRDPENKVVQLFIYQGTYNPPSTRKSITAWSTRTPDLCKKCYNLHYYLSSCGRGLTDNTVLT